VSVFFSIILLISHGLFSISRPSSTTHTYIYTSPKCTRKIPYLANHVSYSQPKQANHALRQIPFNGKKLKPAKIRKDYWRPMAMIQFPEGQGEVGRSVYQRLRECKKLHEYAWDDSVLYGANGKTRTKRERGRCLNNQRANTIADMAAVLGGLGKGNKIVLETTATESKAEAEAEGASAAAVEAETEAEAEADAQGDGQDGVVVKTEDGKTLVQATVWWNDALDRNYAKKWTKNVSHELFADAVLQQRDQGEAAEGESSESQRAPAELVAEQELTKGTEQGRRL
jgi:hypothetical protein